MRSLHFRAGTLFVFLCIFYAAWMTGLTFTFTECEMLPNYGMLAEGFANGHLYIQASPPADTILKDGHRYIFSGPVPALLRLPVRLAFGATIPTGLMIVFFCAGSGVLFVWILGELIPETVQRAASLPKKVFTIVFIAGGVSLHMATIPSIHHESIVAAMFFLLIAVLFFLKTANRGYQPQLVSAAAIALALSLSVGCRFSYAYAGAFLYAVLAVGLWKNRFSIDRWQAARFLMTAAAIGLAALSLLLWYNYLRFGGFLDFGMADLESRYRDYFARGGYFRYDHFPYNFWSLFFRLPQVGPKFPFIILPAYILQVPSIGLNSYSLINTNELTVSVFLLMPILLLSLAGCRFSKPFETRGSAGFAVIAGLFGIQILTLGFTVAAIARYYFDFVPLLLLMGFMRAVCLRAQGRISKGFVILLGGLSLMLSFALPLNAVRFYAAYIDFRSPLLPLFFRF